MSWLAAAVPALAGAYGQALGTYGQQEANRSNTALTHQSWNVQSNEARIQREWEEKMSNSAYQRATDDMKKAGINPMVAFQQGGASTPSGAMAGVNAPQRQENILAGLSSTALDVARLSNDMKGTNANVKLADASATNQLAQASTAGSSAKQMEAQTKAVTAQLNAIAKEAKAREVKAGYDTKFGTWDAIGQRINRDAGSAARIRDAIQGGGGFDKARKQGEKWLSQEERNELQRKKQFEDAEAIFKQP